MQRQGWVLLFHDCIVEQLQKLHAAARRAQRNEPKGFERNAIVFAWVNDEQKSMIGPCKRLDGSPFTARP
jgi:hypothetical protein